MNPRSRVLTANDGSANLFSRHDVKKMKLIKPGVY